MVDQRRSGNISPLWAAVLAAMEWLLPIGGWILQAPLVGPALSRVDLVRGELPGFLMAAPQAPEVWELAVPDRGGQAPPQIEVPKREVVVVREGLRRMDHMATAALEEMVAR